mgnify:CR=1 FL=1
MHAIIQARMGSKRLPGKSLMRLGEYTILEQVIKRVSKSKKIKKIIVATTKNKIDDKIQSFCKKINVECFRGNNINVLSRFVKISKIKKLKSFVRICADSPFIDSRLIDKLIKIFKNNSYKVVTNVHPKTFPSGQSVEIFDAVFFCNVSKKIKKKNDLEHVTTFFYNRKAIKVLNIKNNFNFFKKKLSIDNYNEFVRARNFCSKFKNNLNFSWKKIIKNY